MSEWISVEDRLPEIGVAVLICSWAKNWRNEEDVSDREIEALEQWKSGFRYQYVATRQTYEWEVRFSSHSRHNSAYCAMSFRDFEDGVFPITHWMELPPPPL